MATNFLWKVNSMSVMQTPEPDFVVSVTWSVTAKHGSHSVTTSNVTDFVTPGDPYTPYDALTEDMVLGWVKDQIGSDGVKQVENFLLSQISVMDTPPAAPEVVPLPWG